MTKRMKDILNKTNFLTPPLQGEVGRGLLLLLLLLAAMSANAQGFDPTPPGEPNAQYKISVSISNPSAGTVFGGGSYATGRQVTIRRSDAYLSTNSTVFYKFKCWTLNGVEYAPAAQSSSFTYTVGTDDVAFEAVYVEEDPDNVTSKVFLIAEPADACTFNTSSGQRYWEDNYASVYCYPTSDAFKFQGWYEGNNLVSTNRYYNHLVGKDNATLIARFTYEPTIPGDPTSSQENVANGVHGDVNGDGKVTMADAVAAMDYYLHWTTASDEDEKYDVNRDGKITMADAVEAMNIYLTTK